LSSLPLLYSFRRCPYAIRARLALHEAGMQVELREITLRDKPAELVAVSPKATVPVLVLPSGEVLEQSLDIMLWALRSQDPHGWLSAAPLEEQLAQIAINDGGFKALLDRYKYPERNPEQSAASYRDQAVALMLAAMEQRLARSSHLFSEQCSLADMAVLPFVRQFAAVDADWFASNDLPHLRAWLQRLLGTAQFEAVMFKLAPWRSGDPRRLLLPA
jgi:glutathione S-transferase